MFILLLVSRSGPSEGGGQAGSLQLGGVWKVWRETKGAGGVIVRSACTCRHTVKTGRQTRNYPNSTLPSTSSSSLPPCANTKSIQRIQAHIISLAICHPIRSGSRRRNEELKTKQHFPVACRSPWKCSLGFSKREELEASPCGLVHRRTLAYASRSAPVGLEGGVEGDQGVVWRWLVTVETLFTDR